MLRIDVFISDRTPDERAALHDETLLRSGHAEVDPIALQLRILISSQELFYLHSLPIRP